MPLASLQTPLQNELPKYSGQSAAQLPDSTFQVQALAVSMAITAFVTMGRILYGKDDIRWRQKFGEVIVAMGVSAASYACMAQVKQLDGYASVIIGVGCGLFLNDGIKMLKAKFGGLFPSDPKGEG